MDTFSVEVTAEKEHLNLWIPEIGAGCRAQFADEVKVTAQNLIYIVTGRPRKSYGLQVGWDDSLNVVASEQVKAARGSLYGHCS